ncbi:VTT domain-containing protein [Undibacterium sp. TJN19]|uniref:VTT domain-containing protein n=1 Tax=Undibacterium sp. TJN19 TaxID=3413055 RepID=UPI003BF1AD24
MKTQAAHPLYSWRAWSRLGTLSLLVLLAILIPFGLWGDALDKLTPQMLANTNGKIWIALLGIALLIADVLLPIPSSLVGMAVCWSLGPFWGGISLATGLALAFAFGYLLGRMMPEARLRQWVGAALWDSVRNNAQQQALWWIVIARPLPVLAEMSAILAGVWRVRPLPAFSMALLSSIIVAALYAGSVWLGGEEPGIGTIILCTMLVPTFAWVTHRLLLRKTLWNKRL